MLAAAPAPPTNFIACNVDESSGAVPHVGRQEAPEVFTFKVDDAGPYEFVLAREHLAHVTAAHERIKEFEAALRKIAVRDFSKAGLRMIAKQALNGVTLND